MQRAPSRVLQPGPNVCAQVFAKQGLYGMATQSDPWSQWDDVYYGGRSIEAASNIVFRYACTGVEGLQVGPGSVVVVAFVDHPPAG